MKESMCLHLLDKLLFEAKSDTTKRHSASHRACLGVGLFIEEHIGLDDVAKIKRSKYNQELASILGLFIEEHIRLDIAKIKHQIQPCDSEVEKITPPNMQTLMSQI